MIEDSEIRKLQLTAPAMVSSVITHAQDLGFKDKPYFKKLESKCNYYIFKLIC